MATNFADVHQFHTHFGLPAPKLPEQLEHSVFRFRHDFMEEELEEFRAAYRDGDLAKQADALIDLVYVAMGTAVMMGIPWQLLWDEVQRKNMEKIRVNAETLAGSTRQHPFDIVKPEGWTPPDIEGLLSQFVENGGIVKSKLIPDTETHPLTASSRTHFRGPVSVDEDGG